MTTRPEPGPIPELGWTKDNYDSERKYCRETAHQFVVEHVDVEKRMLAMVELGSVIRDERRFAQYEVAAKMRARIAELEAEVARLSHVPTDDELAKSMTPDERAEEHNHCTEEADKIVQKTWGESAATIKRYLADRIWLERLAARGATANELRKVRGTLQGIANEYAKILTCDPRVQNYAEITYLRGEDGTRFALTIRRVDGLTPSELLEERDTEWRAAVQSLIELESSFTMKDLLNAKDEELSGEGLYARSVFRRVRKLIDEPMPAASVQAPEGKTL